MQHPQPTPPAYYSELATLLADDAEPLPTDILDFIDELELHDCAGSAERRAGAPGSTSCAPEAQPAGKAQREPEGTSPDRATDTGNASRIKRLRQRNREAQARFRLKQKGHRQQVEAKAQQTRAAIADTHKRIEALHETRKQLAKRQERADTMLEATLLLRAAVEQPAHAATARTWAARSDTAIPLRVSDSSAGDKPPEFTVSKPDTSVEGIAPQSLSAFHAHLPISYKSLQGTDDMPTFTAHPVSTRLYNCCVADGLSAKCEQYRLSQAAQQGVQHSQVAWFAQMHTEVDAGVPLSFSTTVASPSCAASFVLAFLSASMEAALCACLHDQQEKEDAGSPEPTEPSEQPAAAEPSSPAGNTDSPSPGQKRTRDAAALDTTATVQPASKEAATALPTKRISLDCYSPAHCTSVGVGTGSSAHSDQHFLTELRIDRDGAPGGANTRMQTPSTAPSCGNYSCCNTAAVATRADEDANSTGSAHSAIHLPWGCSDKSVQHARATLARADSMHVSCSTKEQHNLVSAVKFVYKSVVARYCGHVCQNDIQKICRKGLQVVEEMLKGIYMAVEAREEAMGGKTLCIHNRSHVPDDCLFFRGMSEHIIGLLLTVQKEVRSLVHDLPAMVASAEAPTAESAAALQSHAVGVMLNARMGHMLVARDCTTVLGLLTIDVLVPLMECSEVDANVFKALKLKNGQRSAMATFWQQWEEYRRRLDDTATAAIEKLAGLPTTQPVPKATMDWINALCGEDEPAETEDAAAAALCTDNACCKPLYDTQPRESHCGAKGKARYLASRDRSFLQSKDLPQAQGTENLQREHLRGRLTTGDIMEGTQKPSTAEILEKGRGEKGLVGQSGHYATAAHTAIQMLTQMHRADKDLYINCLDAQMPAAVLSSAQVVQLWAATQMHDGFPFDFLNLCRMAYAQERRIQLLQKQKSPFLGQMLVL